MMRGADELAPTLGMAAACRAVGLWPDFDTTK